MDYKVNDIIKLKKPHPCNNRCNEFIIISIDGEVRLKCVGCNGIVLLKINAFKKAIKQ